MNTTTEINDTLPVVHLGCMVAADPIPAEISGRISQYFMNPGQVLNLFNTLSACTCVCLPQCHGLGVEQMLACIAVTRIFSIRCTKRGALLSPKHSTVHLLILQCVTTEFLPALTALDFIQQNLYFPCARVTGRRSHCTRESVGRQWQPDLEIQ